MTNFELVLTIDAQSVSRLQAAGQSVLLARVVNDAPAGVIWQSLEPVTQRAIVFGSDYRLYGWVGQLATGAAIRPETEVAAEEGRIYDYDPTTLQFSQPTPGAPRDGYVVRVAAKQAAPNAVGLAQAIDGGPPMPLSATEARPGDGILLVPTNWVVIAVQPKMASGTYYPRPLLNSVVAELSPDKPVIAMKYDATSGKFVPGE